ncbi:MAG TPA: ATP-binding protein [Acidimicrobiales bacterium]|nr:ATP-binding protein [Acidimicrobiales bacterium]
MPTSLKWRASFEGGFSPRVRRAGVVYVLLTLPVVVAVGSLADGRSEYLVAFVLLASGVYTTPALVVTWLSLRVVPQPSRQYWTLWAAALVCVYSTGIGILAGLATGFSAGTPVGVVVVGLTWVFLTTAVAGVVRTRSGRRAVSVDVVEWLMFMTVVSAPAALVWGDAVLSSDATWFALPAALATLGMVSGCYWAVVLFVRLGPERTPREILGVLLAMLGVLNGGLQTAQAVSGFTLPSGPLLGMQGACMSLLLLVPLYMPANVTTGLSRLPLHAQVRGGGLAPAMTLLGVPVLLAVVVVQHDDADWAVPVALGVTVGLLVLAAIRQLLAVRETRRLYALVEKAARDRRDLLARMIRRIDEDRHAVAAQLHEQAMSAYATFVSYLLATTRTPTGGRARSTALSGASAMVRDDMSRHAESLRQLMLAVGPLDTGAGSGSGAAAPRSESLQVPIQAYVDSLWGDDPVPQLTVDVDADLVLDWITETVVLRIIQEAVRNVWRHSRASRLDVSLDVVGALFEVRIADDGVGFDPHTVLYESGIAAMRSFAAFTNGSVDVDSAPGTGTVVRARLGVQSGH